MVLHGYNITVSGKSFGVRSKAGELVIGGEYDRPTKSWVFWDYESDIGTGLGGCLDGVTDDSVNDLFGANDLPEQVAAHLIAVSTLAKG